MVDVENTNDPLKYTESTRRQQFYSTISKSKMSHEHFFPQPSPSPVESM